MAKAAPRRRLLPAWMGTADGDGPAVAPAPAAGRRQAAARPSAAVVRCMNEAELVDTALAVLAEKLQREEGGEKAWSRREEEQELPLTPGEAPGSTASTGVGSDRGAALPATPGAGADAERTGWEDSQDDVLKYVREIFFS
ncbi:cell cycle regulator of non-homologous end joining isoform X2 [Strigops habroptila]|uniref:cell cycle regulator of non-homologous end joining isoform X2 n=1 Tax=Strigops habroptila TaxID=2489341 RepID=UPI0011D0266C|nr:cell cycle regulator of non-homologous end joining isoform X2 [Strigops habroptila]